MLNLNDNKIAMLEKKTFSTEVSLFDNFEVRKVFCKEERYFPIQDIVFVLTQSKDIKTYIRDMKYRDGELAKGWGKLSTPLWVNTRGGRQQLNCTNTKGALRLIQAISSPRVEPFKQWLVSLGNERIDEINNPELGIQRAKARAIEIWRRQGHNEKRITQRLQSIHTRNAFTEMLKEKGIKEGFEYVLLTNKVYSSGLGVEGGAGEYRKIKGLKKTDNLRDHMDNLEIALVDLAEAGSQKIIEEKGSKGFEKLQEAIIIGSEIAGNARKNIEKQIGKSVINKKNYLGSETFPITETK